MRKAALLQPILLPLPPTNRAHLVAEFLFQPQLRHQAGAEELATPAFTELTSIALFAPINAKK